MVQKIKNNLISLKELAAEKNVTQSFLLKLVKSGLLQAEMKGKSYYSSSDSFEKYQNNFTFGGFLFSRAEFAKTEIDDGLNELSVAIEQEANSEETVIKKNLKEYKEEIKHIETALEDAKEIGIEEALVEKWHSRLSDLNSDFDALIQKSSEVENKRGLLTYLRQIKQERIFTREEWHYAAWVYVFVFSVVVSLNMAIYSVAFFPEKTFIATNTVDSVIKSPYRGAEQLAQNYCNKNAPDKNFAFCKKNEDIGNLLYDKDAFSRYIRENQNNLDGKTVFKVKSSDLFVKVAGIDNINEVDNPAADGVLKTWGEYFKSLLGL